ncbi:unnamed protein product [Adineta steineri]|uniref:Protein kinase domain-containing protein n=1 Tax=Adineta steineri TaxID=433720 RepID=A0A814HS63_9BILA|nr:unnamed protein product [Adineta steineri]CAF3619887.1 unnamed protein product [Adineta steineri]
MTDMPTIQRVSPSYVTKALVSKPYGTYVIRYQTTNDEIISAIQINNSSTASTPKIRYVVLSVRVDETLYKCPIMNYRLPLTKDNHANLLQQYKSQHSKRDKLTKLTNELILKSENRTWLLDSKEFHDIDFKESGFGGKNNSGTSTAIWQRRKIDNINIFIKRIRKPNDHFDNELHILKELNFFSTITLYGYYSDPTYNYLVLSNGGKSLKSICPIIGKTIRSRMSRIANIGFQIANAMVYLDKKNIVHRDLTASNVLIDSYGFIRIADFGHAIQRKEGENHLTSTYTKDGQWKFQSRFLAPECISKRSQTSYNQYSNLDYASFSSKSDVWAFGLLLIQLMLKAPSIPYPDLKHNDDVLHYILVDRKMHPKPDDCDYDLYCILQLCWAYEPISRISFNELRDKMRKLVVIFS